MVIADIKLDRRSSSQIAKGLKAASAETSVMILTEIGDTDAIEADAIVAIPCSPVNLLQRIENALRKAADPASKKPSHREKKPSAESPRRRAAKA